MRDTYLCFILFFVVACGGGSEEAAKESVASAGLTQSLLTAIYLESVEDLPECESVIEGQLAYIEDLKSFETCQTKEWVEIDTAGDDGKRA